MSTIILNVVIILGIIIAGGFLIFFVGDLLMSIIDPNGDEKKIKAKRKKDVAKFNEDLKTLSPEAAEDVKKDPKVAQILALAEEDENQEKEQKEKNKPASQRPVFKDEDTGAVFEAYEFDAPEKPEEEEKKEEVVSPVEEDDEEAESEDEKRLREAREALERRKAEILRRLQLAQDDKEEEAEEDSSEEEKNAPEKPEEPAVEEQNEETEDVIEEEVAEEETPAQEDPLDDMRKALEEEKQRYATLIKEMQAKSKQQEEDAKVVPVGSKADYLKRLEEKERALEENEKELRACNKEYKPLVKVKKNLEREENKLRIKEAQVAKQKVALYRVDNYADIDSEKAKKLSEELDLLEGLKLSVQHCREVIASNKDRMPVLEKMSAILTKQNEELKADIENLKQIIDKFEN